MQINIPMRIEKAYLDEREVFIMNNIEVLPNKHIIGGVTIHYKVNTSDSTYKKFRITDENGKSFEINRINNHFVNTAEFIFGIGILKLWLPKLSEFTPVAQLKITDETTDIYCYIGGKDNIKFTTTKTSNFE